VTRIIVWSYFNIPFGRAPKGAPAPRGALPNGVERHGSVDGAPNFVLSGAEWRCRSHKNVAPPGSKRLRGPLTSFALARRRGRRQKTGPARGGEVGAAEAGAGARRQSWRGRGWCWGPRAEAEAGAGARRRSWRDRGWCWGPRAEAEAARTWRLRANG
jgi:hypothetical protein